MQASLLRMGDGPIGCLNSEKTLFALTTEPFLTRAWQPIKDQTHCMNALFMAAATLLQLHAYLHRRFLLLLSIYSRLSSSTFHFEGKTQARSNLRFPLNFNPYRVGLLFVVSLPVSAA